jgi:sucrose phosphorylase
MKLLPENKLHQLGMRLGRLYGVELSPRLMQRLILLAQRHDLALGKRTWPDGKLWDQRDNVLITYGDMIHAPQNGHLATLQRFLSQRLRDTIRIVHLLPFFPYSSDEGFSVIDYLKVNPALGGWADVHAIGADFDLMFDLVLNHCSSRCPWFDCYMSGIAPFRDYFIEVERGTDLGTVVRPRTSPLLTPVQTPAGERCVWTTFSADQIDLDFANQDVLFEFLDILLSYVRHGARIIRLDAIAYLWKEIGSSCINLPQTHEVVKLLRDILEMLAPGVLLLTETNLPQEQNSSYFGDGDEAHMVYQFSLPPLLLHALHTGSTRYLTDWAASLPELPAGCTCLNFTASHDGIGVRPLEGLVPESEMRELADGIQQRGGRISSYTREDGSESPYEFNITYYDALGEQGHPDSDLHIARFLCSQAVMLALKGIPAIYFHSLTATHNDHIGVEFNGQARSINRRRWGEAELNALLDDSSTASSRVFHEYVRLLQLRAAHPAFHPDAGQVVMELEDGLFGLLRTAPDEQELMVCVSNLGPDTRAFDLAEVASKAGASGSHWHELIKDQPVAVGAGTVRVVMEPYQNVWLLGQVAT